MAASNQEVLDYLTSTPNLSDADIYSFMQQKGVSASQMSNATGLPISDVISRIQTVAPQNTLGGVILAGDSWLSGDEKTALANIAFGQPVTNTAIGGQKTSDVLNQLNQFENNGGTFASGSTVVLDIGGNDLATGVDRGTIRNNINEIVSRLDGYGVNVILSGAPSANSYSEAISSTNLVMDDLYNDVAKTNKNVVVVDAMSGLLNQKNLMDESGFHLKDDASKLQFLNQLANAYKGETPPLVTQALDAPAQITQIGQSMATRPRNTVIEGDNIDEQIARLPQVVYETRVDPNNTANWQTFNPTTGEVIDSGTFAGGGSKGLLEASRPVLALAASVLGAPYLSELIAGSTGLTGSALAGATGATIAGGSTALTGGSAEETLRAALLGGGGAYAGSALKDYIASMDVPVDFTNMTPEQIADATETNFINDLKRAGLSNAQITDFINNASGTIAAPVAVSTPVADANAVNITAPASLGNVINTLASTVPTLNVTGDRQVDQQTLNAVNNALIGNVTTTPTVNVTGNRNLTADQVVNLLTTTPTANVPTVNVTGSANLNTTIPSVLGTIPTVTTPTTNVTNTTKEKETDPVKLAQLALSAAGLLGAGSALSNTGTPTGFDVVPIPTDWKTPPKTGVAPFTPLPPINFGDRNLLIGTQWEKFLDPNYGKVPEPIKYSQPSNMSYNDLMSILGSRQGMPPASSLSINDIISGIQNQYGQTPASTMG
jgi:hypothetical protein